MKIHARSIAVTLLVLSLGLQWAMLQTVAWTGMLVKNSQSGSFKDAVVRTFDGQHPCCLCRAIKTARAQESKQDQNRTNAGLKLDAGFLWQADQFIFVSRQFAIADSSAALVNRSDAPPKPPPRCLFSGAFA